MSNNLVKLVKQGRMIPIHCQGTDKMFYVVGFKRKKSSKKAHQMPDWLRQPLLCNRQPDENDLKRICVIDVNEPPSTGGMPQAVRLYFKEFSTPMPSEMVSDEEALKNAQADEAKEIPAPVKE